MPQCFKLYSIRILSFKENDVSFIFVPPYFKGRLHVDLMYMGMRVRPAQCSKIYHENCQQYELFDNCCRVPWTIYPLKYCQIDLSLIHTTFATMFSTSFKLLNFNSWRCSMLFTRCCQSRLFWDVLFTTGV